MELPSEFKELYRHWEFHTSRNKEKGVVEDVFLDPALFKDISGFVKERMSIWEKKYAGRPAPYTGDAVLSTYRFCNMLRELDTQTIEFHTLLNPLRDDFPLWLLNMFYCRMVARPQTVREVGLLSVDSEENAAFEERLLASSRPRYGTPYVFPVSAILKSTTPTRETFIAQYLPSVMEKIAREITTWSKSSVADGMTRVIPLFGFNLNFLWNEVLIDVAYQFPEYIDLYKEFPIGPGSFPTMKRIHPSTEPSVLAARLGELGFETGLTYDGKAITLSAENWEGVGCEFRKYTNLSAGKGRKRLFKTAV